MEKLVISLRTIVKFPSLTHFMSIVSIAVVKWEMNLKAR
jgi:hypothetical protein